MLTAHVDGIVSLATTSAARGHCLDCREEVTAKVGAEVRPHWAHLPDSTSRCPSKTGKGEWHENWQIWALETSCQIEHAIGDHRADIITPKGLVIELQSEPLTPAEAATREQHYATHAPQGMIWVIRQPETVTLTDEGFFRGPISPRLADLDARVYYHDETGPTHAVTFATRITDDEDRIYTSARHHHSWCDPADFLDWASEWTANHLTYGNWRRGVWHDKGNRK